MITTDDRPPTETQFATQPLDPSPLDMAKLWDYAPRQETSPTIYDRLHPPGTFPHQGKVTTLYPRPFMPNVLTSFPSEDSPKGKRRIPSQPTRSCRLQIPERTAVETVCVLLHYIFSPCVYYRYIKLALQPRDSTLSTPFLSLSFISLCIIFRGYLEDILIDKCNRKVQLPS